MAGLERVRERLATDVDEGLFTRGAQARVLHRGQVVLDVALGQDGTGAAVRPDTVFRVYCTIKPVTALAIGLAVDDGVLDLDEPLSSRFPDHELLAGLHLRHLLDHTAGLHLVSGVGMEMVPATERLAALRGMRRPPGWRVGVDAGYSEFAAWFVLGAVLEQVRGQPLAHHLREAVLHPLGLRDTWVGMTAAEHAATVDRIGLNVDLRGNRAYAMAFERTERVCLDCNPAHGGYSTAADQATLYGALLRALGGEAVDGLPAPATLATMCAPAHPVTHDVVLERTCTHGLGFMTDLAQHHFGRLCSPSSFGHSGNIGSSFAFADPAHDLAVAVVFNGIVDPESAFLRRAVLVRAIYQDLGLDHTAPVPGASDTPGNPGTPEVSRRRPLFRRRG